MDTFATQQISMLKGKVNNGLKNIAAIIIAVIVIIIPGTHGVGNFI